MNRETETLERLQAKNPDLKLYSIGDVCFKRYGRVLDGLDISELVLKMQETPIPATGNIYLASWDPLEQTACAAEMSACVLGGLDTQVGYCNGVNSHLNGLEYHKTSELNVAITDLILLLGHHTDIQQNRYCVDHIKAFYVPGATAFEVFGGTLHYGPCKVVSSGFKCVVALPRGTNLSLDAPINTLDQAKEGTEQQMLFRRNKWLLVHSTRHAQIRDGAYPGIDGPNIEVMCLD